MTMWCDTYCVLGWLYIRRIRYFCLSQTTKDGKWAKPPTICCMLQEVGLRATVTAWDTQVSIDVQEDKENINNNTTLVAKVSRQRPTLHNVIFTTQAFRIVYSAMNHDRFIQQQMILSLFHLATTEFLEKAPFLFHVAYVLWKGRYCFKPLWQNGRQTTMLR